MRYYIDTEFFERPTLRGTGLTIEPISYGVVAEDGRELYAEVAGFNWDAVPKNHFIQHHVRPHLTGGGAAQSREEIAADLLEFTGGADPATKPQFWGYFADYDWVALSWLFGRMVDLPLTFPRYCLDLKQEIWRHSLERDDFEPFTFTAHNALDDARWHAEMHRQIRFGIATRNRDNRGSYTPRRRLPREGG